MIFIMSNGYSTFIAPWEFERDMGGGGGEGAKSFLMWAIFWPFGHLPHLYLLWGSQDTTAPF